MSRSDPPSAGARRTLHALPAWRAKAIDAPSGDHTGKNSLPVVDKTIAHDTASGQGFLRYNGDGYGDGFNDPYGPPGHPWAGNRPKGSPGCSPATSACGPRRSR